MTAQEKTFDVTVLTAVTFDMWETLIIEDRDIGLKRAQLRINGTADALAQVGHRYAEDHLWDAYWACAKTCGEIRDQGRDISFDEQVSIFINAIKSGLSVELPELTAQRISWVYDQSFFVHPTPLHPDAVSTLARVKREGLKIGLISNTGMTPGRTVRAYMDKVGILDFFDVLVFSDEVHLAKPSREIFCLALHQMGVFPSETVHVGDDRMKDVAAAKIAGMKAIWVPRFAQDQLPEYYPPDASVEDLAHVADAIIALVN